MHKKKKKKKKKKNPFINRKTHKSYISFEPIDLTIPE